MGEYFTIAQTPVMVTDINRYVNGAISKADSNSSTYKQMQNAKYRKLLANKSNVNMENCLIVDHYLIYPQVSMNKQNRNKGRLVLISLDPHSNEKSQQGQFHYVQIPDNSINLQNISHITLLEPRVLSQTSTQKLYSGRTGERNQMNNQQYRCIHLALISNTQICTIWISIPSRGHQQNRNNKVEYRIVDSYYLLYQPYNQAAEISHNNSNRLVMLNQQVLHTTVYNKAATGNSDYNNFLVIAGLDINFRVVVNIYQVSSIMLTDNTCHYISHRNKNSRKHQQQQIISLISQLYLDSPAQIKNPYQYWFTLTQVTDKPSRTTNILIYQFKIFNEKGLPVQSYVYNISQALSNQSINISPSSSYYVKAQQISSKLGALHNYFHIKAMHQQNDDLYICYTRYVAFNNNQNNNTSTSAKVETHIWVYNLSVGYTKNIIDISGAVLYLRVLYGNYTQDMDNNNKWMLIVTKNQQGLTCKNQQKNPHEFSYLTHMLKMDTSTYNPKYEVSTLNHTQMPVFVGYLNYSNISRFNKPKYYATVVQGNQNLKQPSIMDSSTANKLIKVYQKVQKKSIYCQIWQQLGSIGGPSLLQQILTMLS